MLRNFQFVGLLISVLFQGWLRGQPASLALPLPLSSQLQGEDELGRMVKISEFYGEIVIMEIWAPWSPMCPRTSSQIIGLARKLWRRGMRTRLIRYALESDRHRWRDYIRAFPYDMPWIVNMRDPLGHLSPMLTQLDIGKFPYLLVFAPDGNLIYYGTNIQAARTVTLSAARRW